MTLVSHHTAFSPYDMLATVSNIAAKDPHMVIAPSFNDLSSSIVPHKLKAFADIELLIFFDMQRIQWGAPG